MPFYGQAEVLRQKDDSPCNVVTELDLKTEKFLAERLADVYPDIGFCGEEFGGDDKAERFWLVDPIDGTAHFLRGVPMCTTMIALIESGRVVFSAIYDFVNDRIYYAQKGEGAKMNGEPIRISRRPLAATYLLHEISLDKQRNLDIFLDLRKRCILFNTINCGFEFAMIASGKIEGRIALDPFGDDYDYAPGTFLVKEANPLIKQILCREMDYVVIELSIRDKEANGKPSTRDEIACFKELYLS